jgi:hypothetical protein
MILQTIADACAQSLSDGSSGHAIPATGRELPSAVVNALPMSVAEVTDG